jgi:hypothetical protein
MSMFVSYEQYQKILDVIGDPRVGVFSRPDWTYPIGLTMKDDKVSRLKRLLPRKPVIYRLGGQWNVRMFHHGSDVVGRGQTIRDAWEKAEWALQR